MKNNKMFSEVAAEVRAALHLEAIPNPGTPEFEPFVGDLEANGHTLYAALLRQSAVQQLGAASPSPPTPPRTLRARFRSAFDGLKRSLLERESPFGETVPNKRLAGIALAVVPMVAMGVYAYGYYHQPTAHTNATGGLLSGLASGGSSSSSDLAPALPITPPVSRQGAAPLVQGTAQSQKQPPSRPASVRTAKPTAPRQSAAPRPAQSLIEAPPSDTTPPEVFRRPSPPPVSSAPNWNGISPPVAARPSFKPPALEASSTARGSVPRAGLVSASAAHSANPVLIPTSAQFGDEPSSVQAEGASRGPSSSGLVYNGAERPADSPSSEAPKNASGLLYDGATREASATASTAFGGTPGATAANAPESPAFVPTQTINATLVLNIEVVSGSSAPVVASSSEGNWIGTATLALDRVQIQFTHLVRDGRVLEVSGLAYDLESSQGLTAAVAEVAPTLVPDLLRNGANALNTYAQGLLNGQTTTSAGGVTVSSNNAVGLGTVIAGALGQTFKLPDGSQSFYRIAHVPKGTPFMVLVGIGGQR